MRILMLAEAVTLAHVARPIALARDLAPMGFDCVVATAPERRAWVEADGIRFDALQSIDPAAFTRALAQGRPLYTAATLSDYVRADLALIDRHRPDAVLGDFRLSLAVSARLAKVPYLTLTNAYWSPWVDLPFPMPVLPLSRVLPLPVARALFGVGSRVAMRAHCRPLNRVLREHGLPSVGSELRRVYTEADAVLYADDPALFPMRPMPATHHFLGPVLWSPPIDRPAWWDTLPEDRPIVYVTLGSSGSAEVLGQVLSALRDAPVRVIASTAGAALPADLADHFHCAAYLPGDRATARSSLVICNGGSMTTQQALCLGRPVLGIPSNMDQFMNMAPLVKAGAARCIRSDRLSGDALRSAVRELLGDPNAARAARQLGDRLQSAGPAAERLARVLRSGVG